MFQLVRNWLNGNREYYTGMALLKRCNPTEADSILTLLRTGPSEFNRNKLTELLTAYFDSAADVSAGLQKKAVKQPPIQSNGERSPIVNPIRDVSQPVADHKSNPIYLSAKKEADLLYKQMMNDRAVLFASVRNLLPHEDPNRPDLVDQRKKPCIEISMMAIKVGRLYDRADYVLKHGKLPGISFESEETEVDTIPDHLVKQKLDNARKNLSKMKKRQPTPERLSLIKDHEKSIENLQQRWNLIKSVKESK